MKKAAAVLVLCLMMFFCTSCGKSFRSICALFSAKPRTSPSPVPTRREEKPTYAMVKNAIYAGDADKVRALLTKNPELVKETDNDGNTLLHHGARKADLSVVRQLVSFKSDINAQNKWEFTPLHELARREETNDSKDILIELIECKGDVNARTWYGNTPLDIAQIKGNREVSGILINNGGRRSKHALNLPPLPPDERQDN
jgi:ankyrin repeat protein